MKFEKGKSGNLNGRPKGLQNKTTSEFKEALNNLLQECSPKIQEWLETVAAKDPSKALDHLAKLAEYVYPKLARTEQQFLDKSGEATNPVFQVEIVKSQ